jgi:nucleoside-diphosphate-sugar epimerase
MKVLVTGTDGYIGCLLAPILEERGHEITGLDTGYYRDKPLYDGLRDGCKSIQKDIRTISEEDLSGFDAVIHLAELSNDPLGQLNPEITYKINHRGSVRLAEMAKRAGIKHFIYTSSCSVYGVGSDEYMTEDSEPNPQTNYAKCKVLVERDVSAMADDDFSPTFLRNATAYGPSPRMRFDIVLNNLAGLAWTTRQINMTSDGTPWRPLVHLEDICEAVACCLAAPRDVVHNQIFNVGDSRENYKVREITEIVAEAIPGCSVSLGSSDGDNRSYRVSFDKIHTHLPGFRCHRNAHIGAEELCRIFKEIDLQAECFQYRAYTRLKQINYLRESNLIDDDFFWRRK